MSEVFKRSEVTLGGVLPNQFGLITPARGLSGLAMQGVQLQASRRVNRLYDLGNTGQKRSFFLVGGPSEGQASVSHILGTAKVVGAFLDSYADICQVDENTLELSTQVSGCKGNLGGSKAKAKYCLVGGFGMSSQAEQATFLSQTQILFTGLDYEDV